MPLFTYRCDACGAIFETLVRPGRTEPTACQICQAAGIKRQPSAFAVTHSEIDALRSLDPTYKRMVEDQMARTPDAEPMRHLNKLTPFSAAKDPGPPLDF